MDPMDGGSADDGMGMDMDMYQETTALIAVSGVFLGIGAVCMLLVIFDIVTRQGWKSMMLIMIPVWPINAAYMPLSLYVYWRYGRPSKPVKSAVHTADHKGHNHDGGHHGDDMAMDANADPEKAEHEGHQGHGQHAHDGPAAHDHAPHDSHGNGSGTAHQPPHDHEMDHSHAGDSNKQNEHAMHNMHDMHGPSPDRPMWATVVIGVSHCGAGCVLGDLVGEWLVYGTGAMIRGRDVWPCLLVDYAFALLFGIAFQYFSIAPMTHDYGLNSVWRAIKADILSLTFFEIGLFGWMVIYQVAIWDYKLMMTTWTYWWMMQVGMIFGFITAMPINWWLITRKIKV